MEVSKNCYSVWVRALLKMEILVLTISDTCYRDPTKDASGPALLQAAKNIFPSSEYKLKILPDEKEMIIKEILYACDINKCSAIFTTGGTGLGPRDITPEATKAVIDKEANAFTTAMTVESMKYTDMAVLSRAVAGIRGKTLIVNFPGSVKAVKQCFDVISRALPHAIALISEDTSSVKQTHDTMNGSSYLEHVCSHAKKTSEVDISKVALRDRNSPYPMLSVDDALNIIENQMQPLFKSKKEYRSLSECLGLAAVNDIVASEPLPPFPASIKDGYACIAADGLGVRKVRGAVCAGDVADEPLKKGECVRINTGAPLPPGADCVVQVEDTKLLKSSSDGHVELEIEILKPSKAGQDVRPIGHDIRQGEVVVKAGTLLDAGNIGILATVGTTRLEVYKQPTIGLLSTGNELLNPDEQLKPGHIRDSNKIMLTALLKEYGFQSVDCGISKDNPDAMKTAIAAALEKVDILISTGSVSMGERDILKPVLLHDFNSTIHFGRTNMKPGKPTTFATCDFNGAKKFIYGLPGNPVSAYVTSLLFVLPALRRCIGLEGDWMEIPVTLESEATLDPRPEYARATLRQSADGLTVKLTGNQCSSRLLSTCGAVVLVALPGATDSCKKLEPGTVVKALLTTRPRPN